MVSALDPTLSHAFRESPRFSCGFIRYSTELASRCLDFRLRSVGRLGNFSPSLVLALFPLLGRFVRGAATGRRYDQQKTERGRNASHSSGFHGLSAGSLRRRVLCFTKSVFPSFLRLAHSSFGFVNALLRAFGQLLTTRDCPIHAVFRTR